MSIVAGVALAALDCNPSEDIKKPDPESPEYYLYCNLEGYVVSVPEYRKLNFNTSQETLINCQ